MIKGRKHPVELTINKKGFVVAHPSNLAHMKIGDRFQVKSKDGDLRVVFDRWPFDGEKHTITDSRVRTFRTPGPFTFSCKIRRVHRNSTTGTPSTGYPKGVGAHGNVDPPGHH